MTGLTETIAAFVAETRNADVPPAAIEKAKKGIADTLAVILAGATSEVAGPMLRYADIPGTAAILGTQRSTTPEFAALVNGTFGHALDYDDVLTMMPAHPSAAIVPALLAGLPPSVTGREFALAYAFGVETGAKIGLGMTLGHSHRGFHGTGTLAIFSAAAALARLHRLDKARIRTLLGLCASMASGLQRNFGTMAKPLHTGLAASRGLAALRMVECGITAAPDALEGSSGFFSAYGVNESDPGKAAASLGRPWVLLDPGLSLKKFACTYSAHRGIDGLLTLRQRHGFGVADVVRLDCLMPPGGMRVLTFPRPRNGLESKFSMEYALAAGLVEEGYTISTFSDAAVARPAIEDALARIVVAEDPSCRGDDPAFESKSQGARGFVKVRVTLKSGLIDEVRVDVPPGHPTRELSWDDLSDKFADCARCLALPAQVRALESIRGIERLESIQELVDLLTVNNVHASISA